jgi:hypothetical protein
MKYMQIDYVENRSDIGLICQAKKYMKIEELLCNTNTVILIRNGQCYSAYTSRINNKFNKIECELQSLYEHNNIIIFGVSICHNDIYQILHNFSMLGLTSIIVEVEEDDENKWYVKQIIPPHTLQQIFGSTYATSWKHLIQHTLENNKWPDEIYVSNILHYNVDVNTVIFPNYFEFVKLAPKIKCDECITEMADMIDTNIKNVDVKNVDVKNDDVDIEQVVHDDGMISLLCTPHVNDNNSTDDTDNIDDFVIIESIA